MSWNLLIYLHSEGKEVAPLGSLKSVAKAFSGTFPGLEWRTRTECEMNVESGFSITWTLEGEQVLHGYTNGGYNHLKELAALCKKKGWRIADAQQGEDIDLDDPYASFESEPGDR